MLTLNFNGSQERGGFALAVGCGFCFQRDQCKFRLIDRFGFMHNLCGVLCSTLKSIGLFSQTVGCEILLEPKCRPLC
jgi:hypothetical protein